MGRIVPKMSQIHSGKKQKKEVSKSNNAFLAIQAHFSSSIGTRQKCGTYFVNIGTEANLVRPDLNTYIIV